MAVILNWVWQGGVVALTTALALALLARSRAHDRYLTVWTAMIAVLALPIVPYVWRAGAAAAIAGNASVPDDPFLAIPIAWWTSRTFVLTLLAVWFAIAAGRVARSAASLRRLKRASSAIDESRQDRFTHWTAMRVTGRRTRLVVCPGVRSAAVLGCGSPVIAIAPMLLEHLSAEDLDRVVIHEWAHVQRRDDWAQLLQWGITAVAGWHPAIWWLNRQLRAEREVACDERAVGVTGSAKGYAASLVHLAGLPVSSLAAVPDLAAIGRSGLRHRVAQILSAERHPSSWRWRVAAAGAAIALCLVALVLGGIRAIEAATTIVEARVHDAFVHVDIASPAPVSTAPAIAPAPPSSTARRSLRAADRSPAQGETIATASTLPHSTEAASESSGENISAAPVAAAYTATAPSMLTSRHTTLPPVPIVRWRAAADGGVAIGRESRDAAVATAGYFTRVGKRIAGSF